MEQVPNSSPAQRFGIPDRAPDDVRLQAERDPLRRSWRADDVCPAPLGVFLLVRFSPLACLRLIYIPG